MKTISCTLKRCPLCNTIVEHNNTAPFYGGIECPNPECGVICQFPTNLQPYQIMSRFNTRNGQKTVMPVTTRFGIWATVSSLVILGLATIINLIEYDIHSILIAIK